MLIRKMFRDMSLHKTQFISIFIMAFLGMFIYSGIGGEWRGLNSISNKFYNDTKAAHIWIYNDNISVKTKNNVKDIRGVKNAARRLNLTSTAKLKNSPEIETIFLEDKNISKLHIIKGSKFDINSKNGIWLFNNFANKRKLKVGDKITLKLNDNTEITKTIKGLVYAPEYVNFTKEGEMLPNYYNYSYAFLSYKAFPYPDLINYNTLAVRTYDDNYKEIEKKIEKSLKGKYSAVMTRDEHPSFSMLDNEIKEHRAMGSVFPVIFLSVAVLIILTTMTRLVNNQRTQIGTLKALGFKKHKILIHYLSYGFFISLFGALLGAVLGPMILPSLFYEPMKSIFALPKWETILSSYDFIQKGILMVFICTLATFFACYKLLKETPAQTMRPKAPKNLKQTFIEKTSLWQKLSFNTHWNLRDIFRSKIRSIMAVVGVVASVSILIAALGLKDSMNDIVEWQYTQLDRYNNKISLEENISDDNLNKIIKKTKGEKFMEEAIEIKANGKKETAQINIIDNKNTMLYYTNNEREYITLPKNSLALSSMTAQNLGVKKGDTIKWHIYGDKKWQKSKVYIIYKTPITQGITIYKKTFEKLGYDFKPNSVLTKNKLENTSISNMKGVNKIWAKSELIDNYNSLTEAMNILIYVMILAAVLLALIVLYNLGILAFTERERELATLKVVGFRSSKIRYLLLLQNLWLSLSGIIIGIPLGNLLLNFMCSFLGNTLDLMCIITPLSYIVSALTALIISIIVNIMFSDKIKKIDMVASLKGVE